VENGAEDTTGSEETPAAFEVYYARHRAAVYRWSLQFCGGRVDFAQDVTQDVFVRLFEHFEHLTDLDDLGAWLYRVTANLCKTRLKREQSWTWRIGRLFYMHQVKHDECIVGSQDAVQAVWDAMNELKPRERVAFCMTVFDGKSQREVAHHFGVSDALVSRWLSRAWRHIRDAGWEVENE